MNDEVFFHEFYQACLYSVLIQRKSPIFDFLLVLFPVDASGWVVTFLWMCLRYAPSIGHVIRYQTVQHHYTYRVVKHCLAKRLRSQSKNYGDLLWIADQDISAILLYRKKTLHCNCLNCSKGFFGKRCFSYKATWLYSIHNPFSLLF
jgi:hypothetical protein